MPNLQQRTLPVLVDVDNSNTPWGYRMPDGKEVAFSSLVSGGVKVLAMSAVPIAHTGTTAATVLVDVPIPADVMGPNGAVRVTAYWSMTNNTNSKNLVITWGGINAQIWSAGLTSVAGCACQVMVSNRGSTGSQVFTSGGTGVSYGTLPGFGTASEDTGIAQRIRFTGNLANAGDTLTLERYVVELLK